MGLEAEAKGSYAGAEGSQSGGGSFEKSKRLRVEKSFDNIVVRQGWNKIAPGAEYCQDLKNVIKKIEPAADYHIKKGNYAIL